jgi:hypothetical protein
MNQGPWVATESWWLWIVGGTVVLVLGIVVATGHSAERHSAFGLVFIAAGVLVLGVGLALGARILVQRAKDRRDQRGPGDPWEP